MRGGSLRKSTAQKKAEGTSRKDRDAARLENHVTPYTGDLQPPSYFDDRHRAKFFECVSLLKDFEILQKQDYDSIVSYAQLSVMSEKAWEDCQKVGGMEEKSGKMSRPSQAYSRFMECQKMLKSLRDQFAFNPAARMSIKVQREKPKAESAILKAMSRTKSKTA